MRIRTMAAGALAALLLLPAAAVPAAAQRDAAGIIREALVRGRRAGEDVRNYTVTQTIFGTPHTVYHSRRRVAGVETWVPRPVTGEGADNPMMALGLAGADMMWTGMEQMMRAGPGLFAYGGVEEAAGVPAHRLSVDMGALGDEDAATLGADASTRRMVFTAWVDTAARRVVQLHVSGFGEMSAGSEMPFDAMTLRFHDFRTVEGLTLPHRTTIEIEGAVLPFDPKELAMVRKVIAEGEEDVFAGLAPEERRMVEWLIANADEMFQEGRIRFETLVTTVRVNAGPPPGVQGNPLFEAPAGTGSGGAASRP